MNWRSIDTAPRDGTEVIGFQTPDTIFIMSFFKQRGRWELSGGFVWSDHSSECFPIAWMPKRSLVGEKGLADLKAPIAVDDEKIGPLPTPTASFTPTSAMVWLAPGDYYATSKVREAMREAYKRGYAEGRDCGQAL